MNSVSKPVFTPRLLLELSKSQKVPKLVKYQPNEGKQFINSNSSKQTQSVKLMNQALKKQLQQTNKLNLEQKQQNQSLRKLVNQLSNKADQLQSINEQLIIRLKEIQNLYTQTLSKNDLLKQQIQKKIKKQTYRQLQKYIKYIAIQFFNDLRKQKMNQKVQDKVDTFLQQLVQLNQQTVQQFNKKQNYLTEISKFQLNQNISENNSKQQTSNLRNNSRSPSKMQYQTVLSQLTEQKNSVMKISKLQQNDLNSANRSISPIYRNLYFERLGQQSITPSKRKRIFKN